MEKKTKKELKELRRMEKQAKNRELSASAHSSSEERMKWITLGIVGAIVIGLFGFIIYSSAQKRASQQADANKVVEISDTGAVTGATESAKVTLVEFADFQCPACRANEPLVKQALQEYDGELKFVYKHFPLTQIHQNAFEAARASEAAKNQGKFWEMHDLLFAQQDVWANLGAGEVKQKFAEYAQQIGLNVAQFNQDLDSSETEQAVKEQQDEGIKLGVMATPTFYVNGKFVQGGTYSNLKTAIDEALKKSE